MRRRKIKCPYCEESIELTDELLRKAGIVLPTVDDRLVMRQNEIQRRKLGKTIVDLTNIANPISPNLKGEALELDLMDNLKLSFPLDDFTRTRNRGADILHQINDDRGRNCGSIYWEAKRTKVFERIWIEKLKKDKEGKAKIGIIVSKSLPSNCDRFNFIDGVWITDFDCAIALARTLRSHLLEIAGIKRISSINREQIEDLQNYLVSQSFQYRINTVVKTFLEMRDDLERERLLFQGHWEKRRGQLDKILINAMGIAGEMDGRIGANILKMGSLNPTGNFGDEPLELNQ